MKYSSVLFSVASTKNSYRGFPPLAIFQDQTTRELITAQKTCVSHKRNKDLSRLR